MMKEISLEMVRDQMDHLPSLSCPSDYTLRIFIRGDERLWAKIETLAGEFANQEQASEHFKAEFGPFLSAMEDRCFLLEDRHGEAIGTATAWYGHFAGEERGRVYWVGIVPSYQGRKLSKPLLSAVMARLARDHQKAYLDTQTTSYQAVNLYLSFGFVPYLSNDSSKEGWLLMEHILQRKIL
jgi:ribosomal protein S18 acetylase RimI-like enzyme